MVKTKRAREAAEPEDKPVAAVEQVDAPAKKRKRSDDEPASADVKKKAKKDKKKDKESRKERKDKRKDLQNLPDEDVDENDGQPAAESDKMDIDATVAGESKKEKKQKKEKKEKKDKKEKNKEPVAENGDEEKKDKKDKKEKKDKKKKSKAAETEQNGTTAKATEDAATAEDEGDAEADNGKADRHIVFVGNLPYSATTASIMAHFASLSPVSVRCLTKREDPKACRGIAFVEFGKVWHMRTCLDKFHHSMFEDGISPARKINVELTAGGGGKTQQRSEKIKQKNIKLDENRAKRIEREKNAKEENKANGTNGQQQQPKQDDESHIHPSRRGRVPGQKW